MIKFQQTYYEAIDQSLTDRVHVQHGDISKTLIRKNVATVGADNPFSFVVFAYKSGATGYKVYDSNLTLLYTKSSGGVSYNFAVDRSDESFFALESTNLVNRTKAGVLISSASLSEIGYIKPCVYDGVYLWGYINSGRSIYRISKDLLTIDTWTLKAGVLNDSGIYCITLSQNGSYVFIGCGNGMVGRFALSQVGITGDADWEYSSTIDTIYQMDADSDGSVYASGTSGEVSDTSTIQKISLSGSLLWEALAAGNYMYNCGDFIYATDPLMGSHRISQYSVSDGSYIGRTVDGGVNYGTPIVCSSDIVIGAPGKTNAYVYAFDASDEWGDGETSIDSAFIIGTGIICYGLGDPAGLRNSQIFEGSSHCHGYRVDIKTKTKIEEIN